ncbi:MAG: ATP-binding protein [Acidobacteriota bacterium]|nr:ATP-binding protein [Acidobacteriota bacterium]
MDDTRPDDCCFASVTVPSRVESVRLAASFLVQAAKNMHVPRADDSLFELAIVEALNNAVEHGHTGQGPGAVIVCELELTDQRLTIRILDQGPGYVLPRVPRSEWSADDIMSIPESGYGLSIIQGVFPTVRTIRRRPGEFGLEMSLTF